MFLLLFLDNGLIPFNPGAVVKIFNPIAELVIPMRTPSRKAKVEIEINPVTAEAKTRNCFFKNSCYFRIFKLFVLTANNVIIFSCLNLFSY